MTKQSKILAGFVIAGVIASVVFWCSQNSASKKLDSLFDDMSLGHPDYVRIEECTQPMDAVKGDYFDAVLVQSPEQLKSLFTKLGGSFREDFFHSPEIFLAKSRKNPKYPWLLQINISPTNNPEKSYRVHIEGREPFNIIDHPSKI